MAIIYGIADTEKRLLDKLPKEVESVEDIPKVHKEMNEEYDSMETRGTMAKFRRWNKKRQIKNIDRIKYSPLYRGTKGELKVLNKLKELDDTYHVLCGVKMNLRGYCTYNGRPLRSAQMDFVVVSKRGIVVIEVKNWSDEYLSKYESYQRKYGGLITPHEQVARAGRLLWIRLNRRFGSKSPSVITVLLATYENILYDPKYEYVDVKNMENINSFIQSRYEKLSDEEVKRIVEPIERCVAK